MVSSGRRRVALTLSTMVLGVCVSLSPALATPALDDRAPAVPANLEVPEGNTVAFHAHAGGVQIYVCKPSATDARCACPTPRSTSSIAARPEAGAPGPRRASATRPGRGPAAHCPRTVVVTTPSFWTHVVNSSGVSVG